MWEGVWPCLDSWDSVRLRTASTHWNVPRKYGPHGELFFFLLKKEPIVLSELVEIGPCISAATVKACALISLHMMAEENAFRSDSDFSPDLGDTWRYGCPKKALCGVAAAVNGQEARVRLLLRITSTTSITTVEVVGGHCVHSASVALLWQCHSKKASLSPWTGCDNEGEGCGERNAGRRT